VSFRQDNSGLHSAAFGRSYIDWPDGVATLLGWPVETADRDDLHDGLVVTAAEQACAICGHEPPIWVHAIDKSSCMFDVGGKQYTLPSFGRSAARAKKFS
jgi:hypothetical protein